MLHAYIIFHLFSNASGYRVLGQIIYTVDEKVNTPTKLGFITKVNELLELWAL
jgi:hypothetical protein